MHPFAVPKRRVNVPPAQALSSPATATQYFLTSVQSLQNMARTVSLACGRTPSRYPSHVAVKRWYAT